MKESQDIYYYEQYYIYLFIRQMKYLKLFSQQTGQISQMAANVCTSSLLLFSLSQVFCMLFSHSNDKFSNTFKEKQVTRCGTINSKNLSTDGRLKYFIRHIATLNVY